MASIEKVTMYRTTDGKCFEHSEDAELHQAEIEFYRWCEDHICRGGEWSASMVASEILSHWDISRKDR
jgi:hypothetical protein